MIKYKFAKTKSEQIINIQDLSKENKQSSDRFFCLGCENEMLAILGKKRIKHFRHKHIEINCQPETYLHKLAKLTFYQTYKKCIDEKKEFLIAFNYQNICNHYEQEFMIQCPWISAKIQEFEITQYFPNIQMETKVGKFVPDIVLSSHDSKNEQIFVEIAVTHRSSYEKIKSKTRIIEINIKTEDDLEVCKKNFLKESNNVQFMNFKKKVVEDYCQGEYHSEIYCSIKLIKFYAFIVRQNNNEICCLTHDELLEIKRQKSFVYYNIVRNLKHYQRLYAKDWKAKIFRNEVVYSFLNGAEIKDCFLCRYHYIYRYDNFYGIAYRSVFCKLLEKSGSSNMAYQCHHFQADKKASLRY